MSFRQRTVDCGALRAEHTGQSVTINGWAHKVRDLGGLLFIDVRDRTGLVQVVFPENAKVDIRNESCVSVTGTVRMRSEGTRNPDLATGDVEIAVESHEVLNQAGVLPFPVSDEKQMAKVNEELRVKYRYIDLRRPKMYKKMAIRAAAIRKIRAYMDNQGFLEIETPIITKSTPEGARDYLVPYRLNPSKFYALPQSPQQYKQLLMAGGIERYYQIAKCFRDEAQRSDRQPEFTQLDLEMSFCTQEDVLNLMEGLTVSVLNELIDEFHLEKEKVPSFVRLTYDESMRRFGSDKPDLRYAIELFDAGEVVKSCGFGVFANTIASGGYVRGIVYPGGSSLSRKQISELEELCKQYGAKGMATIAVEAQDNEVEGSKLTAGGNRVRSSIAKFLSDSELDELVTLSQARPGDLICFVADKWAVTCEALARLRTQIGIECNLKDPKKLAFAFVLDFPLVDWNEDEQRWDPTHHPFTSPKSADLEFLESDPGRVRADCYDVVCNGVEWASGSIRIYQPELQARVFKLIGIDEAEQKARFGHMLEAFSLGCPPHGGIAPGIDRLIMFLLNEENIREVIAFPKMGNGYDPMMDAPSEIDAVQWADLGLTMTQSDPNQ
ncbi:aspartate--tRNA ligase [Kamptonema cortianum]|nr:aspartate--tRNA ligase [Geitlerinema splendidum]MDK3160450.1 aspartate--tRNA ligase [Kamptonema cortianum]